MDIDDSQESGKTSAKESNLLAPNIEIDTVQITESTKAVSIDTQSKEPHSSNTMEKETTDMNVFETGETTANEVENMDPTLTSPTVNETKTAEYDFEISNSTQDIDINNSFDITLSTSKNLVDLNGTTEEGSENSVTQSPSDDTDHTNDLDLEDLTQGQYVNELKTNTTKAGRLLQRLRSLWENDINMPSTSRNESAETSRNESSNKRSADQRDETNEDLMINSGNSSDEDSGKRQRMNNTEEPNEETTDRSDESDAADFDFFEIISSDSTSDNTEYDEFFETDSSSEDDAISHNLYDDDDYYSSQMNENSIGSENEDRDEDIDDDKEDSIYTFANKPKNLSYCAAKELANQQLGLNPRIHEKYYRALSTVEHLKMWTKLHGHRGCVNTVQFNDKGTLVASGSDDLTVILWNWATKKKVDIIKTGHRKNVFQAKWLPFNEDSLVTSSRDGTVRLINISTHKCRNLANHIGSCNKLATHPHTPNVVLSVGEYGLIYSSDIREKTSKRLLCVKNSSRMRVKLHSIHSHPLDSNQFCVAGNMNKVLIYDKRKVRVPINALSPGTSSHSNITYATYNYNGSEILATYNDSKIYLFDSNAHCSGRPGNYLHCYVGHRNILTLKEVNFFGPKSEYIISGSDCGNIFMWEKESEYIVQWMEGDSEGAINSLAMHPQYPIMATSGLDYNVKLWLPTSSQFKIDKRRLRYCIEDIPILSKDILRPYLRRIAGGTF